MIKVYLKKIGYSSMALGMLFIAACAAQNEEIAGIRRDINFINKKLNLLSTGTASSSSADSQTSLNDIHNELSGMKEGLKALDFINTIKQNQVNTQLAIDDIIKELQTLKGKVEDLHIQMSESDKKLGESIKFDKLNQLIDDVNKNIQIIAKKMAAQSEFNEIMAENETKRNEYKFNEVNFKTELLDKKISDLLDIFKSKLPGDPEKPVKKKDKGDKKEDKAAPEHTLEKKEKVDLSEAKSIEEKKEDVELNIQAYQKGYQAYLNGNYEEAITTLKEYVSANPSMGLSDNAQYWLAESYYSKKEYDTAADEFNRLISTYPDSNKVPSAMIKNVYLLELKGKNEEAVDLLDKLINKFPMSEEADIGKKKLADLKGRQIVK